MVTEEHRVLCAKNLLQLHKLCVHKVFFNGILFPRKKKKKTHLLKIRNKEESEESLIGDTTRKWKQGKRKTNSQKQKLHQKTLP